MRRLAGTPIVAAAPRRRVLRAFAGVAALASAGAAGTTGCVSSRDSNGGAAGDVYVALARARAIAVLDPATDREVARISLASLGQASQPWRLGVSPKGGTAVIPLKNTPSIGVVAATEPSAARATQTRAARAASRRCEWVRVDSGTRAPHGGSLPEVAQALTADAVGHAYVLVGDGGAAGPSYAAVVDLETGVALRHLPLASAGEGVLAVQASRDGARLYAATWEWDDAPVGLPAAAPTGRLVSIDTRTGSVVAEATLPSGSAVTHLAIAGGAGGRAGVVYATLATPGPSHLAETLWSNAGRYELVALDARLSALSVWSLPHRPNAAAVTPDGARAYLLSGSITGGPWSARLTSLDLGTGTPTASWPLPVGCQSLALSPVGKLYVADMLGDRLWRVDTRRDTFLGSVPQPGVPVAVAAQD